MMDQSYLFNQRHAAPQDAALLFDEATHSYSYEGQSLVSVSQLIAQHFPSFDTEMWSRIKAEQRGCSPQLVREEWALKGARARELGTHLHAQIEAYLQGEPVELGYHFSFRGELLQEECTQDIFTEWALFLQYHREQIASGRYSSYRTEWRIYDPKLRLAGTLDYLTQDAAGDFHLFDWKRSEKLGRELGSSFIEQRDQAFGTGFGALEHLPDSSYWRYALQQNLYRRILSSCYGIELASMRLVVLSPEYQHYHLVELPQMDEEVDYLLACRAAELQREA